MYTAFNGVVRTLQYRYATNKYADLKVEKLFEGQVTNCNPVGFGREIDGIGNRVFVGYLAGIDKMMFES